MGAARHRAAPAANRSRAGEERAFLLVPAGVQGPGFLMLANFRAIMRYNPAEAYALAIGHLADRLRGGQPFAQTWPRYERVLSRNERLEMQQLLAGTATTSANRTAIWAPGRGPRSAISRQDRAGSRRLCLRGRARPVARR